MRRAGPEPKTPSPTSGSAWGGRPPVKAPAGMLLHWTTGRWVPLMARCKPAMVGVNPDIPSTPRCGYRWTKGGPAVPALESVSAPGSWMAEAGLGIHNMARGDTTRIPRPGSQTAWSPGLVWNLKFRSASQRKDNPDQDRDQHCGVPQAFITCSRCPLPPSSPQWETPSAGVFPAGSKSRTIWATVASDGKPGGEGPCKDRVMSSNSAPRWAGLSATPPGIPGTHWGITCPSAPSGVRTVSFEFPSAGNMVKSGSGPAPASMQVTPHPCQRDGPLVPFGFPVSRTPRPSVPIEKPHAFMVHCSLITGREQPVLF